MIDQQTYGQQWINGVAATIDKKVDRKILEKVIYAFTLLEQLKRSGMDFIFKGGTSLLLLSPKPRRFSIDIDIIADYDLKEIPAFLDQVVAMGNFTHWVEDNERKSSAAAPVAHYKFYYRSQVDSYFGEEPILLDILIGTNPYPALASLPVYHPWLKPSGETLTVQMPVVESILGDKLTAFAPNTTGILYTKERPVEMIKQLFDVGFLFDEARDFEVVKASHQKNAVAEIKNRGLSASWQDVLEDSYQTALILCRRETANPNFPHLQKGISNIVNFIIGKFNIEEAIICASKAAYLSVVLRNDLQTINRYSGPAEIASWTIASDQKLNKLKKTNPEAFYYWYQISIL
jgi:hypothetical protein